MQKKIVCPDCEQGWVEKIRVTPNALEGFLCNECEGFWLKEEEISKQNIQGFRIFLENKGMDYKSINIAVLDE